MSEGQDDAEFRKTLKQTEELVSQEVQSMRRLADLMPVLRRMLKEEPGDPEHEATIKAMTSWALECARQSENAAVRLDELKGKLKR